MGFANWFKFGSKRNKDVTVQKVKKQSVDMGAMAAGNPSEAAGVLSRMLDQQNAPTKILMVQDGHHMQQVTDYAMKMAQRLDCEIIALDVSDTPLQFSGDRKARETDRFMDMAKENGEQFAIQAKARGITTEHIMKIGAPEEIIAQVSADNAGIRYVLSKPAENALQKDQERAHIPVFDLRCSRL
ncbi:MAG: hypothetical protein K9K37_00655 [Desulfocapsa sp.]|nr:hypothetical protein [Desulfocapsa sp.]